MDTASSARTGDRSYLRRRNSMAVLEQIWDTPATVAELARATSLSRTAAEAVLADLLAAGWVRAGGPRSDRAGTVGRPAAFYSLAPEGGYLAGVDIGAHHVSGAIARIDGERLATVHLPADEDTPAEDRLQAAAEALTAALDEAGVSADALWAVTVGTPGVIDDGKVIHFGGQGMPGWVGTDVARAFDDVTAAPVFVEGDSALGALAEMAHGAAKDVEDFVYILSGVRTGAAIVAHGELHRGHRGGAGLVGELPAVRWRELEHELYGAPDLPAPRPTRQEIFARADAGDPQAMAAVADFGRTLAVGSAVMVLAVDPAVLVLGGPNAQHAHLFLDQFTQVLTDLCPLPPTVEVSTLGPDAVLAGTISRGIASLRRGLWQAVESQPAFPPSTPTPGMLAL